MTIESTESWWRIDRFVTGALGNMWKRQRLSILGCLGFFFAIHDSAIAEEAADIKSSVLEDGVVVFPDNEDGTCTEYSKSCPQMVCKKENYGKCVCDADVVYPSVPGAEAVTQVFQRIAERYSCKGRASAQYPEGSLNKLRYEVTQRNPVSVVFDGYSRASGSASGCQTEVIPVTVGRDGHVFALDEVLDRKQDAAIKDHLVRYFQEYFLEPSNAAAQKKDQQATTEKLKALLDKRLWSMGFYLKNRGLFIDLNSPLLGCAEGTSFSIPIPIRYLSQKGLKIRIGLDG
jgi:hypothetical protein